MVNEDQMYYNLEANLIVGYDFLKKLKIVLKKKKGKIKAIIKVSLILAN